MDTPTLIALHREGKTDREIAEILGCHTNTAAKWRLYQGLRPNSSASGDGWTAERSAEVKQLWAEGLSASQIAMRLGGITRNAVIGKVHRMGLAGRVSPCRNEANRPSRKVKRHATSVPATAIKAARKRKMDAEIPIDGGPLPEPQACDVARVFSVIDMEPHHCRWIAGDPKQPGWGYCGDHRIPGQSWCQHHAERAFQSPQEVSARLSRARRAA